MERPLWSRKSPAKKKSEMAEGEGEGERSLSCGGCTILEWERLEATIPNKNPQRQRIPPVLQALIGHLVSSRN